MQTSVVSEWSELVEALLISVREESTAWTFSRAGGTSVDGMVVGQ